MSPLDPDLERAAALLERLIADPAFRAGFRQAPAATCEAYGLPELGAQVAARAKALHTLDLRESRSSLAGVVAALAAEAVGLLDLSRALERDPQAPAALAVKRALTRLELPAVPAPERDGEDRDAGAPRAEEARRRPRAARPHPAYWKQEPEARRRVTASVAEHHDHDPGAAGSARALLEHPRFSAWDSARRDLRAGIADPRLVAILSRLVERHEIGVSVLKSGHDKFVAGSSNVSNHFHGRGVDIAMVDGQPVAPGNAAARKVVEALTTLPDDLAPTEVISPWDLPGAEFWTDSAHQDHIHVGFGSAPPEGLKVSAPHTPRVPAVETAGAGAAAAIRGASASGVFAAVGAPRGRAAATIGVLSAIGDAEPAVEDSKLASATGRLATSRYPGDDAPREALAAWLGSRAQKAGLPAELPVMAALVESGLTNAEGGDRDSVGFFQMRTSVWNRGEYAGYATRPELQAKWFVDRAVHVRRLWMTTGRGDPAEDPSRWGEWIADVEQPARQYRGRYQPQLTAARGLLDGQASGPAPEAPADARENEGGGGSERARRAVQLAMGYRGTPYVWGGEAPSGFDCSGLSQYVYGRVGVTLPRVAEDQARAGTAVKREDLAPGDLVFFADSSGYVHHMGISLGGSKFVHAPHTGDVVKVSSLEESYFDQQFSGARRVAGPRPGEAVAVPAASRPQAAASSGAAVSGVFAAVGAPRGRARGTVGVLAVVSGEGNGEARAGAGGAAEVAGVAGSSSYPGDGASKEALARWMAGGAKRAGLPPELPVMAALVESELTNARGGDRDSVGFFQMRTSVWDRPPYTGYAKRPELQLRWFVDRARTVRKDWISRRGEDPADDAGRWGEWIADVEAPAPEHRSKYQPRLEAARRLVDRS